MITKPKLNLKTTVIEKRKPILIRKEKSIHIKQQDDTAAIMFQPNLSQRKYAISREDRDIAAPDDKSKLLLAQPHHQEAGISPLERSKQIDYEDRAPRKHIAPPPGKTYDFPAQPEGADVMIPHSDVSQNIYTVNRPQREISTPSEKWAGPKVFASSQPIEPDEISLLEADRIEGRYSFEKNIRPSETQASPQTRSNLLSFARQEDTHNEEELLMRPIHRSRIAKNGTKQSEGSLMRAGHHSQTPDLSGDITIDEIDPSQLISLKEFNVCINPEEEFRLKTQLAIFLDKPDRCGIDGILFFFKYTESAYTIKTDIYDPQGTLSGDRCSVLRLAIECIENLRK